MIFRKIKDKNEALEAFKISAVAFEYSFDSAKDYENDPEHRYYKNSDCIVAAFEEDNITMAASIAPLPMNFHFDGHVVKGNGIGSVSTLPHKRNKGVIRGCFQKAYEIMKENGDELSYLYPFNRAYYKMFGYELAGERVSWTVPMANFKDKGSDYNIRMIDANKEHDLCVNIYKKMAKNYNLALEREDIDWRWLEKGDIYKESKYTYVAFDKSGEPSACFTYKRDGSKMGMHEVFFSTKESLTEIFDFIKRSFHANFTEILITLPPEIPLEYMVENTTGVSRALWFSGMVRVIDVEKILLKSKTKGSGELVLKINDSMCSWNNDIFECKFKEGRMVSVDRVKKDADIEMDIADFSAFICGSYTDERMDYAPTVKVNANMENIHKLFYAKKVNCFNGF